MYFREGRPAVAVMTSLHKPPLRDSGQKLQLGRRYRRDGRRCMSRRCSSVEDLVLRCVTASYQRRVARVEPETLIVRCLGLTIWLRRLCVLHTDTGQFDTKPSASFQRCGLQLKSCRHVPYAGELRGTYSAARASALVAKSWYRFQLSSYRHHPRSQHIRAASRCIRPVCVQSRRLCAISRPYPIIDRGC